MDKKPPKQALSTGKVPKQNLPGLRMITEDTMIEKMVNALPPWIMRDEAKRYSFLASVDNAIRDSHDLRQIWTRSDSGKSTILSAACDAARQGFLLGNHAYLIPFGDQVQMVVSAKGALAKWRSNKDYVVQPPMIVYENDHFECSKGIVDGKLITQLTHRPYVDGESGPVKGFYMLWSYKGEADYIYKSIYQMEDFKKKHGKNSGPWKSHPIQMMLKTIPLMAAKFGCSDMTLVTNDGDTNITEGDVYGFEVETSKRREEPQQEFDINDLADVSEPEAEPAAKKEAPRAAKKKPAPAPVQEEEPAVEDQPAGDSSGTLDDMVD